MKEQFSRTYKKNAERMQILKALGEAARKKGDRVLEKKYRAEYSELKAQLDALAFQLIMKGE